MWPFGPQGGRSCAKARRAFAEKSRTKIWSPNIRYFVAILRFVAITHFLEAFGHFFWVKNSVSYTKVTISMSFLTFLSLSHNSTTAPQSWPTSFLWQIIILINRNLIHDFLDFQVDLEVVERQAATFTWTCPTCQAGSWHQHDNSTWLICWLLAHWPQSARILPDFLSRASRKTPAWGSHPVRTTPAFRDLSDPAYQRARISCDITITDGHYCRRIKQTNS